MEIISFVGSSSAIKKSSSSLTHTIPHFSKTNAPKTRGVSPRYTGAPALVVALDSTYSKTRTEKQFTALGISKFFSTLLSMVVLVAAPVSVYRGLSFFENHTTPYKLETLTNNYETEVLNSAMSRFAMFDTLADNVDASGNVLASDGSILTSASVGVGETVTFQNYTVRSGDSISTISRKFGLANISTLIAVNNIVNVRTIYSGQVLRIPSVDGIMYRVSSGDSLNSLSVRFHVSVEEILDANDLSSDILPEGMELFIPGVKMDTDSLKKAMGELFIYPITAHWRLTSKFGPRRDPFTGVASNHTGIDMACPTGTPIRAAMSGRVVFAGWSNIFGNYIIINHGNGYQTLYGHMSKTLAKQGEIVDQNTKIGLVGSTGYSTGPHLHFTVYKNGNLVDPLSLLKK